MNTNRLLIIVSGVLLILLVPLVAMQFTNEVNWTLSDFIAGGILLLGSGLLCELILRKTKKNKYRIAFCLALLVVLLLIWLQLAVGIF